MFISEALAQTAAVAETTIKQDPGMVQTLGHSGPVVQLTLLLLLFFSVVSWAIIIFKFLQLKKAQKSSQSFWTQFTQSSSLEDFFKGSFEKHGPLYEVFNAAVLLMPRLQKSGNSSLMNDKVEIKLAQVREEEMFKLEQYTPFLATTASTAPFIGLFGTVWGILTAFAAIGKAGTSSLETVGPYISEALVATAIGLAAAIPAVVAYNYFVARIRTMSTMLDLFMNELVHRIKEEVLS